MRTSRTRVVVAGCAGALLMLTAACAPSPEETPRPDEDNQEWAEGSDPIVASTDGSADDESAPAAADKGAEPTDADSEGSAPPADGAGPAENFDPCTALPDAEVSAAVGAELEAQESSSTPFGIVCGYTGSDSSAAVDLIWYTGDSGVAELLDANIVDWDVQDKLRDVPVPGSSAAQAITGQRAGVQGALVVAQVDGGLMLAAISADGVTLEDVTALLADLLSAA